jgi:hypothetical protein
MATFTGTLEFYNSFLINALRDFDLSADSFLMGLVTSGYTPDASNHSILSNITNELSGNGYARQAITGLSLAETGGIVTWTFNDSIFTATGGSLVARRFFVYNSSHAGNPLVGFGLLDNANLDVTTTDGNTLTVQPNVTAFGRWIKI